MNRIQRYLSTYGRKYNWSNMGSKYAWVAKLKCFLSRLRDGSTTEEYVAMELYKKSQAERDTYICMRLSTKINNQMMSHVELSERRSIGNKLRFDELYSKAGFVKRDFIGTKGTNDEEIKAFIEKHRKVIVKPLYLNSGNGIRIICCEDLTPDLLKELSDNEYVMEELIVQHHAIAEINPSSVNTVRIVTVLDKDRIPHVLGATLRCGGPGNIVDNLHSGGVGYPIDLATGVIHTFGRDNETEKSYDTHPSSGKYMIGMKIPHWEQLIHEVCSAALLSKNIIYLGWDIAITETGIDFIEANFGHGADTIQYDNVGKKPLLLRYLEGTNCSIEKC